jgi:hypothetical protein
MGNDSNSGLNGTKSLFTLKFALKTSQERQDIYRPYQMVRRDRELLGKWCQSQSGPENRIAEFARWELGVPCGFQTSESRPRVRGNSCFWLDRFQ